MTGQEVWEAWKKNLKKKFKHSKYGVEIMLMNNSPHFMDSTTPVSIECFLNGDWQPVEQWKEVTFLKAIEAWANGSDIKSKDENGSEYFYEKQSLIDHKRKPVMLGEARFYKWSIKE